MTQEHSEKENGVLIYIKIDIEHRNIRGFLFVLCEASFICKNVYCFGNCVWRRKNALLMQIGVEMVWDGRSINEWILVRVYVTCGGRPLQILRGRLTSSPTWQMREREPGIEIILNAEVHTTQELNSKLAGNFAGSLLWKTSCQASLERENTKLNARLALRQKADLLVANISTNVFFQTSLI